MLAKKDLLLVQLHYAPHCSAALSKDTNTYEITVHNIKTNEETLASPQFLITPHERLRLGNKLRQQARRDKIKQSSKRVRRAWLNSESARLRDLRLKKKEM